MSELSNPMIIMTFNYWLYELYTVKLKLITIFDMASFKYFVAYLPIPTFRTVFGDDSFMFAVPEFFSASHLRK